MSAAVHSPMMVQSRLRDDVERLCRIDRPSASAGEREAAHVIADTFRELGAHDTRVETERAHGGYWLPMAGASFAAACAGVVGRSRRRWLRAAAGVAGAAAAAGVYNDLDGAGHGARRLLGMQRRETFNVLGFFGSPRAARTLVFIAHHDAARSGLLFHPAIPRTLAKLPLPRSDSSPPLMWPVLAAPLLAAAGAAVGSKAVATAGAVVGAGAVSVFSDIARSKTVPGANDNLSGVATLIELARRFAAEPPADLRVLLLSCGSEESFMEGMAGFGRRHFPDLPVHSTTFVCLDTVGSERLCLLDGEGMVRVRRYDSGLNRQIEQAASACGVTLKTGVTLRNATDGLYPLRAGYRAASIGSYDEKTRSPGHYHWKTDRPDTVNYRTVAACADICQQLASAL